ncbi:MAG: ATP-dependent Clp protease ATP-binding subunit [Planctomycetaceae bacterium]|nr:ATP-dependent Clp protease ATP-binding subunit [Planctomycetaceae bacterium]
MDLTIPVYVETETKRGRTQYRVRPLFREGPAAHGEMLEQTFNRLSHLLREGLMPLGRMLRHDQLAEWTCCPDVKSQMAEIRVDIGRQTARLRLLLVLINHFDRRIGFTPTFPGVWFEVFPEQNPNERLTECLNQHLAQQARDSSVELPPLTEFSLKGTAWVTEIDVRINPPRVRSAKDVDQRAFLGTDEAVDGESELYRVGRCLDHMYPDDLHRAVLREAEVAELSRLLTLDERRPVLLIGPRQSGKTAVLHEHVCRMVESNGRRYRERRSVWLLSPQRLISGMCYAGQWETRFHAIISHAARRDQILYFDDVPGLFQAGISSQSSLNVGALLRSVAERQEVRIVAEMTPEELRIFRERDRSFADMFHVIPIREMTGDDNLRVLISLQRQLEYRYRCRYELDALPTVIDLQRRYHPNTAFPGKGAQFLQHLAVAGHQALHHETSSTDDASSPVPVRSISRDDVLRSFQQQSGLPVSFLDQRAGLAPDDIRRGLRRRFVGQDAAVEAAVEIISIAKARLNDPARPLASLLLTGPTGVGKTEFARSLATYLFGHADRLQRFDMNEYVSPQSVAALVGTFLQPEGLLTASIRRQPFAVVLFDEIEKAHPDVFDLLLQVLGEGRLTDARGRTTDFSNTILVLTSNLGTHRTAVGLGFGETDPEGQGASRAAVENFFRPEFVNRLDRIIPFGRLSPETLQLIARHVMADVLNREGLVRRRCVLKTSPAALRRVVERGYDAALGARALKRAIESELTQPIAMYLAANPVVAQPSTSIALSSLTLIDVDLPVEAAGRTVKSGEQRLAVKVRTLFPRNRAFVAEPEDPSALAAQSRDCLNQVLALMPSLKSSGSIDTARLTPGQLRWFLLQDECSMAQTRLEVLEDAVRSQNAGTVQPAIRPGRSAPITPDLVRRRGPSHGNVVGRIAADDAIADFLEDEVRHDLSSSDIEREAVDLVGRTRWLSLIAQADSEQLDETVVIQIHGMHPESDAYVRAYSQRLSEAWTDEFGLECHLAGAAPGNHGSPGDSSARDLQSDGGTDVVSLLGSTVQLRLQGPLAREYAVAECGFHVIHDSGDSSISLMRVCLEPETTDTVANEADDDCNEIVRVLHRSSGDPANVLPSAAVLRQEAWNRAWDKRQAEPTPGSHAFLPQDDQN